MANRLLILAIAALVGQAGPLAAQDAVRTRAVAVQPGYTAPAGAMQILLFEPEIAVSEQSAGGLEVPSADLTVAAQSNLEQALTKALAARGATLKKVPPLTRADEPLMKDYRALFKAIASAAFTHKLFPGDALPTKRDRFDWSLGAGAAELRRLGGGDYGLFIFSSDVYNSRERKAVEAISELLGQKAERGTHVGYAGLVDLASGDLVWINANVQIAGDVRSADGAALRASQLLQGFPKRAGAVKGQDEG